MVRRDDVLHRGEERIRRHGPIHAVPSRTWEGPGSIVDRASTGSGLENEARLIPSILKSLLGRDRSASPVEPEPPQSPGCVRNSLDLEENDEISKLGCGHRCCRGR